VSVNHSLIYLPSQLITFSVLSKFEEQITDQYDDVGMRCERDAFDTLFDHAPDKLAIVKKVDIIHSSWRLD
jgi:hypothetical protein